MIYDVIIIGGGVAGLSAAVYAARFNLKTVILTERRLGLLQDSHLVENWIGVISSTGYDLMKKIEEHALNYKVPIIDEKVTGVNKKGENFQIKTDKNSYEGKTVILATGTKVRELGIPGEQEFKNKGVSYCALCDAPIFKNKIVGVVGGSDSAAKESLLLSEYAKQVYIIYRKDEIRAEPINAKRVSENKKIVIINNTNVLEIKGGKFVEKVILDRPYKGSKELKLDGLFIYAGHVPNTELAKKLGVKLNEKDEIIINISSETNVPGVFAAGDCANREFKQAITGAAEGVSASYSANEYLKKGEK